MIVGIILVVLIIISVVVAKKSYNYDVFGEISVFLFSVLLAFHLIASPMASYNYNIFMVKRNAFIETLEDARLNNRKLEAASIVRDVAEYNKKLVTYQYDNNIWFLGQYVDDRFMDVKPIR